MSIRKEKIFSKLKRVFHNYFGKNVKRKESEERESGKEVGRDNIKRKR